MGFSCTIKAGKVDLTKGDEPIHGKLFGLGPDTSESTKAPYRVTDFRTVVGDCEYGNRLADAARDAFRRMQHMAAANLKSLEPEKHCETCSCPGDPAEPHGWSVAALKALLAIDADTVTFMEGGY